MTVSQPDGDGQSSSLAPLVWTMMTVTLMPVFPPWLRLRWTAPRAFVTSSGWQHKRQAHVQEEEEEEEEESEGKVKAGLKSGGRVEDG